MSWVWMAAAGLISGILGGMGMGGGGVLIIYLTLYTTIEQHTAQGINLLSFIPCALVALCIYLKKHLIDVRTAILAASLGLVGALLGTLLAGSIDAGWLKKIFGGLLAIIGLTELFQRTKKSETKSGD